MNNEEMKVAVLAECERLCPEVTDQFLSNFDLGLIGKFRDRDGYHWTLNSSTGSVLCCIYEHQNDAEFMRAYRLLGLEAKAKDAEIENLKDRLTVAESTIDDLTRCCNEYQDASKANDSEIERLRKLGKGYITVLEFENPEDDEAKFNLEVLLENARVALKGDNQ